MSSIKRLNNLREWRRSLRSSNMKWKDRSSELPPWRKNTTNPRIITRSWEWIKLRVIRSLRKRITSWRLSTTRIRIKARERTKQCGNSRNWMKPTRSWAIEKSGRCMILAGLMGLMAAQAPGFSSQAEWTSTQIKYFPCSLEIRAVIWEGIPSLQGGRSKSKEPIPSKALDILPILDPLQIIIIIIIKDFLLSSISDFFYLYKIIYHINIKNFLFFFFFQLHYNNESPIALLAMREESRNVALKIPKMLVVFSTSS